MSREKRNFPVGEVTFLQELYGVPKGILTGELKISGAILKKR